jgi:hypothetical protein
MPLLPFNSNPTRRELRQFACIWLPLIFLAATAVLWKVGAAPMAPSLVATAGLVLGVLGWTRPQWFRPIFVGWMAAAYPVGWVISHLVLAVLYFAVLTPIGLALRIAGRDPMNRRWKGGATTYWTEHKAPADDGSYFRQY